jgi:drug/metabolite transporter (DMT)-like permease
VANERLSAQWVKRKTPEWPSRTGWQSVAFRYIPRHSLPRLSGGRNPVPASRLTRLHLVSHYVLGSRKIFMSEPVLEKWIEPRQAERTAAPSQRGRAIGWLLFSTILWGASFPVSKAVEIGQRQLLPDASSWFLASYMLVFRFGIATVILALFAVRTLPSLTRSELWQGAGLGLFGGIGILLQIDGLAFTNASTSAFLTMSYCVMLPLFVAIRQRALPPPRVVLCSLMVFVGMAALSGINWQTLRIGRGEIETIIASLFFAGQILWLERPLFHRNRSAHATIVMFALVALICLPVGLLTQKAGSDWIAAGRAPAVFGYLVVLTAVCTMVTFSLMNRWQRFLSATEAGLIYAAEPVWTSLMALSMPAWLGLVGGFVYANEVATSALLVGGALITAANVLIQLKPPDRVPIAH